MMRFQRVRPDLLHLPNGKKPTTSTNHPRTCKEDEAGYPAPRVRPGSSGSASASPVQSHFPPAPDPTPSEHHQTPGNGNGRDMLLQWGHNKRSRGSRAEARTAGDESTTSSNGRQMIKVQRRAAVAGAEKIAAAAAMPPPCGVGGGGGYARGANLRPCMPLRDSSATNHNRTLEERSGGQPRPEKNRSPPSPPDKPHKKPTAAARNGFGPTDTASMSHHHHPDSNAAASDHRQESSGATGAGKATLEQFEWPRIYVSLSRKEKEDDFLAMKGTKLPQRPKKRAKNVDKTLQYCFPGMWLSDLTRGRYEVREKKCVKKKPRGLKGMESDSE
ncbi:putative protein TPRXL isoform X2 [Iris pallida]|uniref:Uncharacterized protein n=1 Tax=Iris pallida TaxID=29817 RepID=A0AAX6IDG0_IRIPA|nr:putative protein TPRXL isoform X2 [Iris pallida]